MPPLGNLQRYALENQNDVVVYDLDVVDLEQGLLRHTRLSHGPLSSLVGYSAKVDAIRPGKCAV